VTGAAKPADGEVFACSVKLETAVEVFLWLKREC
jgi:hypothetical protein